MNIHLNKEIFKEFLNKISVETKIDTDILEKDYYVCCVLKELSCKQDELKAYFKGGTAIYKILDTTNRFSEDIDITVEYIEKESNNKNDKRLKKSATNYNIEGLELDQKATEKNKGSITTFYNYDTVFENNMPLQRAGKIQIEATSFTVSEPYEKYTIEPMIYKFANDDEKTILKEKFAVSSFEIKIITLERMFIDKIFATEFYYIREKYFDTSKHLYDIANLWNNHKIQELMKNAKEIEKLIEYKREEEKVRKGGVDEKIKLADFTYLNTDINSKIEKEFKNMQNKYVFNEKYKISIGEVNSILEKLKEYLKKYNI